MNGYGKTRGVAGLGVDVMTARNSLQLPAGLFQQPSEVFSSEGFQTAMSTTLSVSLTSAFFWAEFFISAGLRLFSVTMLRGLMPGFDWLDDLQWDL
jgi:hypothetical protein